MLKTTLFSLLASLVFSSLAWGHPGLVSNKPQTVVTSLDQAQALKAPILARDLKSNLAVTYLSPQQLDQLSQLNHFQGHCAGFEVLSEEEAHQPGFVLNSLLTFQNEILTRSPMQVADLKWNEEYQKLADTAKPEDLKAMIQWISSYPSRYEQLSAPNQHVVDLKSKLQEWMKGAKWPFQIEEIQHNSTRQNTLRLTIPGKLHPDQVIVLGAHFDSINHSYFGTSKLAPGADDNASGSSNLIEALKILKNSEQPERTLEFYWYAAEETGLLGSAEIAKAARLENKNVIAVLQLDMTLYPGKGEQVVGLVDDFTSPWLRELFTKINETYVKAQIVNDTCGYGCSDHASWHRQKYHAVTPFEATTETMNRYIHTEKDVINADSSFQHSNTFTKFAVLFALVLGNSDLHAPSASL